MLLIHWTTKATAEKQKLLCLTLPHRSEIEEKVAAAAITEKYGGLGETALTKKFKGDWQNTNLIIALVTGGASTVVASRSIPLAHVHRNHHAV